MEVGIGIGLIVLCAILAGLLVLSIVAFWVWMLVDCLLNESSEGNDKIVWLLVIFFLYPLGAILYFFVRRGRRMQELGR